VTKADYLQIRAVLSFRRRFEVVLLVLAGDLVLFTLGLWLVTIGRLGAYLLAQLLFVVVFFHAFAVLHECGHGCVSSRE
jgi:hypothetical protein